MIELDALQALKSLSLSCSPSLCVSLWECESVDTDGITVLRSRTNAETSRDELLLLPRNITWRSKHHVCCTSSLSVYPLFLWVKEIYWDVEDYIYIRFWVKSDELCLTFSCTVQQEGALWISELSEVKVRLILQLSGLNPDLKAQHNY